MNCGCASACLVDVDRYRNRHALVVQLRQAATDFSIMVQSRKSTRRLSSSACMKDAGPSTPCSGWRQRANISSP
jgi:hypothetical protein